METNWFGTILLVISIAVSDARDYKLDLDGAERLTNIPRSIPLPSRVEVYAAGCGLFIDKAGTPANLLNKAADLSITNETDILNLISVFQQHDNKARIPNVAKHQGYTYHFLFVQEEQKTVIHFRVFEPSDTNTVWALVYPRSPSSFSFFNDKILTWLHSRMKPATAPPSPPCHDAK